MPQAKAVIVVANAKWLKSSAIDAVSYREVMAVWRLKVVEDIHRMEVEDVREFHRQVNKVMHRRRYGDGRPSPKNDAIFSLDEFYHEPPPPSPDFDETPTLDDCLAIAQALGFDVDP